MASVCFNQLRENLADVLNFVKFKNGRVIVTRHGKPVAEIVPIVDSKSTEFLSREPEKIARQA